MKRLPKYTPAEVRNDPYGFTYKEMSEVIGENEAKALYSELYKQAPRKKNLSMLVKDIYGNTAQIAYRESHSKLVCRAASIIPSVRLAGRINSGCQAGPVSQDQVRQSEQHIQFSGLLPQAPVPCLSVSEPTLDDRKYVFHFSANR